MLAPSYGCRDHEYMTERISVHGSIGYGTMAAGDALVDKLIKDEKLPYDFEFRALGIDEDHRTEVLKLDILAAAGHGEPSGEPYLSGPLPNCVVIPSDEQQVQVMRSVGEDYHRLADLRRVARHEGARQSVTYNIWASYIQEFNPVLFDRFRLVDLAGKKGDPGKGFVYGLSRAIIRDEPLFQRYQTKERLLGTSAIERRLLHLLLLENHPELGPLD